MKYENKIKNYLSIFLMIQPFFDIYWLYHLENVSSVFVFSPSTIIRMLVFFILFILFILDKKKFKTTIAFGIVCLGYFILHHYVAVKSVFYNNDTYSLFSELFYIIRISIPLYLIYLVSHYKFEDDRLEKIFYTVALIFSAVMIITNILGIALPAYPSSDGIKGNIFIWFISRFLRYNSYDLATKGIFNMANQVSGVFILIFPILMYYLYKNYSKKKLVIVVGMIISMFMLSTRVSSYGVILILVVMLINYLINNYKNINKDILSINILLIIFSVVFMYFAPISIREFYDSDTYLSENTSNEERMKLVREEWNYYIKNYEFIDKRQYDHFMEKYSSKLLMPATYFGIYPIEYDKNFWLDYFASRTSADNRYMEKTLITHLDKQYRNKKTILFGHSYSKTFNNGIYLEKDYLYQYYALGVVGIFIFFVPYVGIVLYAIYKVLRYRKYFTMKNITFIFTITLLLGASYMSGNIMDTFIDTIFLAFICGLLLNSLKKDDIMKSIIKSKKKDKEIKVSVIIPVYNVEEYIERCLMSVVNQTLDGIEAIVVNDGSKDNSLSIIKSIAEKYPDRITVIDKFNEGVSIARNTGLKEAKGEFVGFVDSDDWIEPTMYEKLYNKAKNDNLDVVACDSVAVYPDKKVNISSNLSPSPDNKELFINAYAVIWNKIYRRDLISDVKFKPNVWYEDVLYLYMLYPRMKNVGVVNEVLYNYLQREGSITYTYNEKLYQLIENMDDIVKYYEENNYMELYKDEVEYSYIRYLYGTFIKRLAKSKNKKEFNRGVKAVIEKVNEKFPNYKKNKYIKQLNPKSLYLKYFNKTIANVIFVKERNKAN